MTATDSRASLSATASDSAWAGTTAGSKPRSAIIDTDHSIEFTNATANSCQNGGRRIATKVACEPTSERASPTQSRVKLRFESSAPPARDRGEARGEDDTC